MGSIAFKLGLLVLVIIPLSAASLCQFGKEYWSPEAESCVNCTRCEGPDRDVVIRPCQVHKDTVCGSLSSLPIEWQWTRNSAAHERTRKEKQQRQHNVHNGPEDRSHHLTRPSAHARTHHEHEHHNHEEHSDRNELNDRLNVGSKHHKKHRSHDPTALADGAVDDGQRLTPGHRDLSRDSLADVSEWEQWLRTRLEHKKEKLLKNLLEEESHAKENHRFLSESSGGHDDKASDSSYRPVASKLDVEIFEKLLSHEQKNRNKRPMELMKLVGRDHQHDGRDRKSERLPEPGDVAEMLDLEAMVPTRLGLFLGEPSTVSEMVLDQEKERSRSPWDAGVSAERVPFTAAETFVWDWQAVALISAVAACLLFFGLAALYSLLHVRQWRRLKNDFHIDVEDLALRVSLMQSGGLNSSTDGGNTNHYLEQLLAGKKEGKNMSNVYVEKQPTAS